MPEEFDVPFAHTPAFVGSHVTGYDNAMKGIVEHFWDGKAGTVPALERKPNDKINFIGGFDGYTVGNMREIKRIFDLMGVEYTILGDNSDVWDTPTDGEFRMYDGGTTLEDAANAVHAKATISMQEYCTEKTLPVHRRARARKSVAFNHPMGVAGTDKFLMEVSRLTGKPIPRRAGKGARPSGGRHRRLATPISTARSSRIYGDPGLLLGLTAFLLELGAEPVHVLSTNGGKAWAEESAKRCSPASPFGKDCKAYAGKDLWHMRSLLFTEPVDFLIGNTYGKYPGARHRHAADPHRLPDLRPPPPPPLSGVGLPGRHECAGDDPRQDLRRDRPQHHRSGEDRLQLRHHPLIPASAALQHDGARRRPNDRRPSPFRGGRA